MDITPDKITVRELGADDLQRFCDSGLLRDFYYEGIIHTGYRDSFNPDRYMEEVSRGIAMGMGVLLVLEQDGAMIGFLHGVCCYDYSQHAKIAFQANWFVAKAFRGNGLPLLRTFESWSAKNGAEYLVCGHMINNESPRMGNLFVKLGFRELQRTYIKDLQQCQS